MLPPLPVDPRRALAKSPLPFPAKLIESLTLKMISPASLLPAVVVLNCPRLVAVKVLAVTWIVPPLPPEVAADISAPLVTEILLAWISILPALPVGLLENGGRPKNSSCPVGTFASAALPLATVTFAPS